MTEKLRLYLEKVIARMNLDDTQREAVEREFTGHLDEVVVGAIRDGLSRENAEAQAMTTFGEPSVIARQFGLGRGYGWLLFERCALGLVVFLLFRMISGEGPPVFRFAYAAFWGVFVVWVTLWNKIEVNGVLRVRRCFRRTRKITFESIADVRFVKGHLFGARNIRIETHDHKSAIFSPKFRNARCAGLALTVLVPEAVRPEVLVYFREKVFQIQQERFWLKIFTTALWLAALLAFAMTIEPLWNLRGFTGGLFYAWGLAGAAWICQVCLLVNRAKKGVITIIGAGLMFTVSAYGMLMVGYLGMMRWFCLLIPALYAYAIFVLWWRGSRSTLLKISLVVFLVLAAAFKLVPHMPIADYKVCGVQAFLPDRSRWLGGPDPLCAMIGFETDTRDGQATRYDLVLANRDTFDVIQLPDGYWSLLDNPRKDSLTFVNTPGGLPQSRSLNSKAKLAEVRFYSLIPGKPMELINSTQLEEGSCLSFAYQRIPFWSPSGDYYLLPAAVDADGNPHDVTLINRSSGEQRTLAGMYSTAIWWGEGDVLNVILPAEAGDDASPDAPLRQVVQAIDARTGRVSQATTFDLPAGFKASYVVCPPFIRLVRKGSQSQWLWNNDTRMLLELPPESRLMATRWKTRQIAYLTRSDDVQRLVIENGAGEHYERDFALADRIDAVSLSPDGAEYLYSIRPGDTHLLVSILAYKVHDMKTGQEKNLWRTGAIGGNFDMIMRPVSTSPVDQFLWSNDGRTVVFPTTFYYLGKADSRTHLEEAIIWSTPGAGS